MALNIGGGMFPPGRDLLINYDWTDISNQTGYISFDGFATVDSVSAKYVLIKSDSRTSAISIVSYSSGVKQLFTDANVLAATLTKALDVDFDLFEFQLPQNIKGQAYIRGAFGYSALTAADSSTFYVIAKIRKWDGTTETDIVTVQSATVNQAATVNTNIIPFSLLATVPLTNYKKAETLRLTIEVWSDSGSDTNYYMQLYHDPQDATINDSGSTAISTRLVCVVPFKIEV